MKKIASTLISLLVLSLVLVSFPQIDEVKAQEAIRIRADGSLEGTDKIQCNGDVYTFTDDIIDSYLVVEKDDVVIDGAGYSLQGNGNENGISLSDISNNTVKNLKLSSFHIGIVVMGSGNNKILENTITDNFRGLDLTASENNTISGNFIANNTDGIALENINNNIVENTITNNTNIGIFLYGAGYNNIIGNNITNNGRGILVSICYNNIIHHNNFVNNTNHVETDDSNGIWDNGSKGNYWDDYSGIDNNSDGIGDTPYIIYENNQDNHPLMNIISELPIIYIRADGSVDGTDNIQQERNIYTLTGNIYDPIVVEKDNIIVDGRNYILQGTGTGRGIELSDRKNVTVKNFKINHFETGIYIYDYSEPRNNTISENIITNNIYGLYIENAHNNTIFSNTIANNEYGIFFLESRFNILKNNNLNNNSYSFFIDNTNFVNDVDTSNLVDGKPMIYWVNQQDRTVPSESGYVALINCKNITIRNLNLEKNAHAILLASTTDSTIAYNTITKNEKGIFLRNSSNNTVSWNSITNNECGIRIQGGYPTYAPNNKVYGNIIENNNGCGISIRDSVNNTINGNNITNNECGISFSSSTSPTNNIIHHNNFINNTEQASAPGWWHMVVFEEYWVPPASNVWDDGEEGNYWSNYLTRYPNATEIDGCIWDTPYNISENNQDNYPLMEPGPVIPEFPSWIILPLLIIAPLIVIIFRKKGFRSIQD